VNQDGAPAKGVQPEGSISESIRDPCATQQPGHFIATLLAGASRSRLEELAAARQTTSYFGDRTLERSHSVSMRPRQMKRGGRFGPVGFANAIERATAMTDSPAGPT
jgi:hypothetical protein